MKLVSRFIVLIIFAATLCSCGPEVVPSSGPRAATTPDQVNIYQKKPSKYEELGMVSLYITPDLGWDQNGDANKAFDIMKAKAAALGANGLLLDVTPDGNVILTQGGYHSKFYIAPMVGKVVYSQAIYVLKE